MSKGKRKLHKYIIMAYLRITQNGGVLSRQASNGEEAMERCGGYIYFASANNYQISPASARFLIEEEIVKPIPDGLFADSSQSFEAITAAEFNDFKERYEKMPVQ